MFVYLASRVHFRNNALVVIFLVLCTVKTKIETRKTQQK